MGTNEELITIFEAYGIIEAEIVRAKLECAGIPVSIAKVESVYPSTVNGLGKIPLIIPASFKDLATELLATDDGPHELGEEDTGAGDGDGGD